MIERPGYHIGKLPGTFVYKATPTLPPPKLVLLEKSTGPLILNRVSLVVNHSTSIAQRVLTYTRVYVTFAWLG